MSLLAPLRLATGLFCVAVFFFVARSAAPPLSALSERFKIRVCHKENRGDLTLQQDLWQPWWTCVCLKRRNARRNGSIQWVLTN